MYVCTEAATLTRTHGNLPGSGCSPGILWYVLHVAMLISKPFLLDTSSRHQTSIIHSQFCELSFPARAKGRCAPLNNHGLAGEFKLIL